MLTAIDKQPSNGNLRKHNPTKPKNCKEVYEKISTLRTSSPRSPNNPQSKPRCKVPSKKHEQKHESLTAKERNSTFENRSSFNQRSQDSKLDVNRRQKQISSSSLSTDFSNYDAVVPNMVSELTVNITETDSTLLPDTTIAEDRRNKYVSHYKDSLFDNRATKCFCPGQSNSHSSDRISNENPMTFQTSLSLQCNEIQSLSNSINDVTLSNDDVTTNVNGVFPNSNNLQSDHTATTSYSREDAVRFDDVKANYNDVTREQNDVREGHSPSAHFQRFDGNNGNESFQTYVAKAEKDVSPQTRSTKFLASTFVPVAAPRKLKNQKHFSTKHINVESSASNVHVEQFDSIAEIRSTGDFTFESKNNRDIPKVYELDQDSSILPDEDCPSSISRWRGDVGSYSHTSNYKVPIVPKVKSAAAQCDIVPKNTISKNNIEIQKLRVSLNFFVVHYHSRRR